jgi:glycosyltransferase involved in cell wall biosynthesis
MAKYRAFYQLLAAAVPGDAVTDFALLMRGIMREQGIETRIFAGISAMPRSEDVHTPDKMPRKFHADEILCYHHATGTDVAPRFAGATGARRVLFYQGVTPPALLGPGTAAAARAQLGIDQLRDLVPHTHLALASSGFNRRELEAAGFRDVLSLHLAVSDPQRRLLESARAGRSALRPPGREPRFLYVGRVAPHKSIGDLFRVLAEFRGANSGMGQLSIVGDMSEFPDYAQGLMRTAIPDTAGSVRFTGKVSSEQLASEYADADIYLCASRHEGFCMPLVESMFAGIPVIARDAGAIGEVTGGCSLVIADEDPAVFAEAAQTVLEDPGLRARIITAQDARARLFTREAFAARLHAALESFR